MPWISSWPMESAYKVPRAEVICSRISARAEVLISLVRTGCPGWRRSGRISKHFCSKSWQSSIQVKWNAGWRTAALDPCGTRFVGSQNFGTARIRDGAESGRGPWKAEMPEAVETKPVVCVCHQAGANRMAPHFSMIPLASRLTAYCICGLASASRRKAHMPSRSARAAIG